VRELPTIVLDPSVETQDFTPTVLFRTAVYGIHRPGTAYRMDEVPIPLKAVLPTELPADAEVLTALVQRITGTRAV
jgi:formylmethanofuran dehydrogenase subunit B